MTGLFVKVVVGSEVNLGASSSNYSYPLIFAVQILASALLMAVIFVVVYTKGLRGFSGIVIGAMIDLDIFFFVFVSDASMNPARSLAPALVSGEIGNLWLYWTATFAGTSIISTVFRKEF